MSFTRFQGFGFFTNWRYNSEEKELLRLEAEVVKDLNRYHDLVHRLYVDENGALPREDHRQLMGLIGRVREIRTASFSSKQYRKVREKLEDLSEEIGIALRGVRLMTYDRTRALILRPQRNQRAIEDLPGSERWRLFINPKDFQLATHAVRQRQITYAGDYYGAFDEDNQLRPIPQRSDAFRRSMTEAIERELIFGGGLGRTVDYREYVRLHDLVTGRFVAGDLMSQGTRESMRRPSSVETATAFPINDWDDDQQYGIAPDLLEERICDLPLVSIWKGQKRSDIRSITFFTRDDQRININYTERQGRIYLNKLLFRYYQEIAQAATPKAKLKIIVKAIRAIHVLHPFRDANGRLNIQILLNKFLLEQGFSPTILGDQGLGIFGGVYSVDQLAGSVSRGMERYRTIS